MRSSYLDRFIEMLLAERGASQNTVDSYGRDLNDFAASMSTDISAAGPDDIRNYLHSLADSGMSEATAARRLSALRQYFRFLQAEELREDDPTRNVESPRRGRALPKVLSETAVDALLLAARDYPGPEGVRFVALLEVLYATGLRVSELVSLPLSAARKNEDYLLVRGKGGRERIVPLSQPAKDAIAAYVAIRDHFIRQPKDRRWLFPSRAKGGHLTRQRLSQLLKELAVKAGIDPGEVSPHGLRHAFASHMLAHGADLRAVQKILGHADISTTQIYTHVLENRLRDLVEQHHPLAD